MNCLACYHYEVCSQHRNVNRTNSFDMEKLCKEFKEKSKIEAALEKLERN